MSGPGDPVIGIDLDNPAWAGDMLDLECTSDGQFRVGVEGVRRIITPQDRRVEWVAFSDKTLAVVRSNLMGTAIYPLQPARFEPPAEAVLMDLDGTSVHSETFWMWVIERSIARLMNDESFRLVAEDEPHVSGHSVSEHLQYCINKYCPGASIEQARANYYDLTDHEMAEIAAGRGKADAFSPAPDLKEFLEALKQAGIRIGLVTSGLHNKAWPEILAAFRQLDMGDPRDFYDCIITAGHRLTRGQCGTLGELAPKPHPWLYAETAYVGLGITPDRRHRVVGIEDSGAGMVSIRLAGFAAIGLAGGNIERSGTRPLLNHWADGLMAALPYLLGKA